MREFVGASAAKAVDTAFAHDLKSAGVFSIPLTLIILVVAFGAARGRGYPAAAVNVSDYELGGSPSRTCDSHCSATW